MQRGPKAARSAATKARLLDATIDCLVELGWAGTSTTEVVRRAGVSRGAQVHHFPTKDDLVLAAVEHLLLRRVDEFRATFEGLEPAQRSHGAALQLLWTKNFGPNFDAWLELVVAARSDELLHARVVEVEKRFWEAAVDTFQALFPEAANDTFAQLGLRLTFAVLDGMAIGRLVDVAPADIDAVLTAFTSLTQQFFPDEEPS